ncbi:unnamed protein product [Dovyalis caffra]|uniref:AB hydrolase-1 domain-containing protein n=1 Tax=Dovyalis caffra TaxID=77055 RepID=A0AAV1SAH0_9ROSI|nr:unnamed protein product [Dovyalis caffra]
MENIEHTTVATNGINMHIASIGTGPVILFLHGFPELWYSWRHQLLSLSSLGYRCIAPDLRGYGDTDAPASVGEYTGFHIVGDLIGLLDSLGIDLVFLVGHDWGAMIAWNFCTIRPDRVKALVNTSVPFLPRNPQVNPVQWLRALFGDDYYLCRFQNKNISSNTLYLVDAIMCSAWVVRGFTRQKIRDNAIEGNWRSMGKSELNWGLIQLGLEEPGEAEEEFAQVDTTRLMIKFLTNFGPNPPIIPKGVGVKALPDPPSLPAWLSEEDINYYAGKFNRKGFTGGLNCYRAINITWELMAPWTGIQIKVPVKFIIGDLDLLYHIPGLKDHIHSGGFNKDVPLLEEVVVMEGVAHFLQQEKPEEVSKHIYDFIKKF